MAVGGFLYSTLASLALGLLISAVRWMIVDQVLSFCGINGSGLKYEKLSEEHVLAAYQAIVANHYRYYQCYSNSLIALCGAFAVYAFEKLGEKNPGIPWYLYAVFLFLVIVLFSASWDTLKKTYDKMRDILK